MASNVPLPYFFPSETIGSKKLVVDKVASDASVMVSRQPLNSLNKA